MSLARKVNKDKRKKMSEWGIEQHSTFGNGGGCFVDCLSCVGAVAIIVGLATTVTPYYRENGVPMFRNLNIRAGYLDDSNILYLAFLFIQK